MGGKINMTRVSLDIPIDYHKQQQLKAVAALRGKTLRQLILESLDECISKQTSGLFVKEEKLDKIPEHELWAYDPEHKKIVAHIGTKTKGQYI